MSAEAAPSFYRVIKEATAQERDFYSAMMVGRTPPRPDERERPELWAGVSLFDSPETARRRARRFPALGAFLARIGEPDPRWSIIKPTLSNGHYTAWGRAEIFLAAITDIIPV